MRRSQGGGRAGRWGQDRAVQDMVRIGRAGADEGKSGAGQRWGGADRERAGLGGAG